MLKTLNIGCGQSPLKNNSEREYFNMDMLRLKGVDNYLRHNLLKIPWPLEGEFDEVFMFHTIEHIPEPWHKPLVTEIRRVLKDGGKLAISYPEFTKCAMNYINNAGGKKDFWKATIYGRGLTEWDRHKTLMDTPVFIEFMTAYGFHIVKHYAEPKQQFNTVCIFKKGEMGLTYEGIMEKQIKGG